MTMKPRLNTDKHASGEGVVDERVRTYLFLSDSWRKNLVDVNERQLVLIKNEIAPPHMHVAISKQNND